MTSNLLNEFQRWTIPYLNETVKNYWMIRKEKAYLLSMTYVYCAVRRTTVQSFSKRRFWNAVRIEVFLPLQQRKNIISMVILPVRTQCKDDSSVPIHCFHTIICTLSVPDLRKYMIVMNTFSTDEWTLFLVVALKATSRTLIVLSDDPLYNHSPLETHNAQIGP